VATLAASRPAAKSAAVGWSREGVGRPSAVVDEVVGVGFFGLGFLCGFGMRCWAIRLPMTTKAIPTSSLVPWIVALRAAPSSVDGPETAMRALEMSVASLRLRPTLPMR
jgi:hypothetical protein